MGFFSWNCAKTGEPILAGDGIEWPKEVQANTQVVYLTPNGSVVRGEYDGYGRVNGTDVTHRYSDADVRDGGADKEPVLVIAKYYDGEKFEDLKPSEHQAEQGYFWDDDELLEHVRTLRKTRGELDQNGSMQVSGSADGLVLHVNGIGVVARIEPRDEDTDAHNSNLIATRYNCFPEASRALIAAEAVMKECAEDLSENAGRVVLSRCSKKLFEAAKQARHTMERTGLEPKEG